MSNPPRRPRSTHVSEVTWDGRSGRRARAQQAARVNIALQEQIQALHKAIGLAGEDDAKEKIGPSKMPSIGPDPYRVIIRKGHDPKANKPLARMTFYYKSPFTGERLTDSKLEEHIRDCLQDPSWRNPQGKDEVRASRSEIKRILKRLAERRADLYGAGEAAISGRIGEEEVQANITLQGLIRALHKALGSVGEDDTGEKVGPSQRPPVDPTHPDADQVIIREDYDPIAPKPRPSNTLYHKSPFTGELIAKTKLEEHIRICTRDPSRQKQRDPAIKEEVYAPGLDIESSLKRMAERRTDIFGAEETAIGKRIGEEDAQRTEEKVTWDGHSGSMARTQQAGRANVTLQEQIKAYYKTIGLVGEEDSKEKRIKQVASSRPPVFRHSEPPSFNVGALPPSPHIMAPRPPPVVLPAGFVPAPPVSQPPSYAPAPPSHPAPPHEDGPKSKRRRTRGQLYSRRRV